LTIKIQYASDLHLERFGQLLAKSFCDSLLTDADVLVLAGDICTIEDNYTERALYRALDFFYTHYEHVIYVPGNHELYHSSFRKFADFVHFITANRPRLHASGPSGLNACSIRGVKFYYCTLWFSKAAAGEQAYRGMADSRLIKNHTGQPVSLADMQSIGKAQAEILLRSVKPGDVVITHHMPSYSCVAKQYVSHPLNDFFVNKDAEKVINECRPALWIHGHSHEQLDKELGDTRVVRNPYGYMGMEVQCNLKFDRAAIIEI